MAIDCSYNKLWNKPFFFFGTNLRSTRGGGGSRYSGQNSSPKGAGSLSSDCIKYCAVCAHDGFPHEAIIFVKSGVLQYIVPFESVIGKKITKTKWQVYDYFTGKKHEHKSRIRDEVAA